jgi:16S rRNA (guanine966-N2)-methyltransferase
MAKPRKPAVSAAAAGPSGPGTVRIIGGRLRGRKLPYSGDPRTRPMKDRVREAVFNLLGPLEGPSHAIDLFAGTGALGLEAISRGASRATFIEQHYPTAQLLERNIETLGLTPLCQVIPANTFAWLRRGLNLGNEPWLVFSSPPYEFYVSRLQEMLDLIGALKHAAPDGSALVVESDARFDFSNLPNSDRWDVRPYAPAVVGVYWKS